MRAPDAVIASLIALEDAASYCRWLAGIAALYCGRRIVELGSGSGNVSRFLIPNCERAWLLEGDESLCIRLRERFKDRAPDVQTVTTDLDRPLPPELMAVLQAHEVDTVFSSNVLEHVFDDLGLLRQTFDVLRPGGRSVHIVPAQPWLFNSMDRAYGHYRRYTKREFRRIAREQRWTVEHLQYFNLSGIAAWLVAGFTAGGMQGSRVGCFERYFLPLERALARFWRSMPIGLSLIAVLRKP